MRTQTLTLTYNIFCDGIKHKQM